MALIYSKERSEGVSLELKIAAALGIEVFLVSTWIERARQEDLSDAF